MRSTAFVRALAATAALLSGAVTGAAPAHAVEGDALRIAPEQRTSHEYPVTAPEPVASASADARETLYTPDQCAAGPTCTRIPILLDLPADASKLDDFFINIRVEMAELDDYDAMLWHPDSDRPIATSATAPGNAEVFNSRRSGETRRYDLVVWNYTALEGFKVSVALSKDAITTPFESLETPVFPGSSDETITPPSEQVAPSPPPDLGALPELEPVVAPDASLAFAAPPSAAELTAPPAPDTPSLSVNDADEPSGLALAAWLVGLPVGLLAAAGWVLRRRRPAALRWA